MSSITPLAALGAALLLAPSTFAERPGPLADGGFRLATGWTLRPAGQRVGVDRFPVAAVAAPGGRFLLVLNSNTASPSISVVDLALPSELSRVPLPGAGFGLALTRNGRTLYAAGGPQSAVFEFHLTADGQLKAARTFLTAQPGGRQETGFTGALALTPDDRLLYAGDSRHNQIAVINPQSGRVIETFKTGRRPAHILFPPDGKSLFISSALDGAVYHHEAESGRLIATYRIGPHPAGMVWSDGFPVQEDDTAPPAYAARLFVAVSNTNKVTALGVTPHGMLRTLETISVSLEPQQPLGITPTAVALSADGKHLYVACSAINALAVVDISGPRGLVEGFIPTAAYPTAVTVSGARLAAVNALDPRGAAEPAAAVSGSVTVIQSPDAAELAAHTRTVMKNSPYRDARLGEFTAIPPGNPVPRSPAQESPIQHVLYIVKDSLAYDQIFGDAAPAAGEAAAPNHHKLAREFVRFDNFYTLEPGGLSWATAAMAADYIWKTWFHAEPGGRSTDELALDPGALPPAGFLWTQAASAGLSLRNYGFFTTPISPAPLSGPQVSAVRDPVLRPATDLDFRGVDPAYSDLKRAEVFIASLNQMERQGSLPRLLLLRLAGASTARSLADHDTALGRIVEACSRSRFWPRLAIFVVEAGAPPASNPTTSRRSIAYVVSPYTRRGGAADSTFYSTLSALRTIELIVGLRPMTTFDAAAEPMWRAFSSQPNLAPYAAP